MGSSHDLTGGGSPSGQGQSRAARHLHTTLSRHVYPGLGHNVCGEEIADLAAFLREQLTPAG